MQYVQYRQRNRLRSKFIVAVYSIASGRRLFKASSGDSRAFSVLEASDMLLPGRDVQVSQDTTMGMSRHARLWPWDSVRDAHIFFGRSARGHRSLPSKLHVAIMKSPGRQRRIRSGKGAVTTEGTCVA
jgi:hypothetical protein